MASRWAAFRKGATVAAPVSVKEDGDLFSRAKHTFDTMEVGSDDESDDMRGDVASANVKRLDRPSSTSPAKNSRDKHRSKRQKSSSSDLGEHEPVSTSSPRKPQAIESSLPSPPQSTEESSNPFLQAPPNKSVLVIDDDEEDSTAQDPPARKDEQKVPESDDKSPPVQIDIVEDTRQNMPPAASQSSTQSKQAWKQWEDPEDLIMRLAREARARAKTLNRTPSHNNGVTTSSTTNQTSTNTVRSTSPQKIPQPPPDPIVEILITSQLPQTRPAILRCTLNAPLKEARKRWCAQYGLSEDISRDVVLTFKKQKLFDYTTCKSLKIGPDADGITPFESIDPADPTKSTIKVHFEATTEQLLSEWRKKRAAGLIDANGNSTVVHEPESQHTPTPVPEHTNSPVEKEKPIRLILRAKGRADVKIRAKPSSTVARLKEGYREEAKVGPDAIIEFHFDGERLEEEMTLAEADLEDMASVDVYVR